MKSKENIIRTGRIAISAAFFVLFLAMIDHLDSAVIAIAILVSSQSSSVG